MDFEAIRKEVIFMEEQRDIIEIQFKKTVERLAYAMQYGQTKLYICSFRGAMPENDIDSEQYYRITRELVNETFEPYGILVTKMTIERGNKIKIKFNIT